MNENNTRHFLVVCYTLISRPAGRRHGNRLEMKGF